MGKRGPKPRSEAMAVLSTRIRAEVRVALEVAAKQSGRTLSGEIEARLRQSLNEDEKLAEQFGSRRNFRLIQVIGLAMRAQRLSKPNAQPTDWIDDAWSFQEFVGVATKLLELMAPKFTFEGQDQTVVMSRLRNIFLYMRLREARAEVLLKDIQAADSSLPLGVPYQQHVLNVVKSDLFNSNRRTRDENVNQASREELKNCDAMLNALEEQDWTTARRLLDANRARVASAKMDEWWETAEYAIPARTGSLPGKKPRLSRRRKKQ